jgi:hypothetical protein
LVYLDGQASSPVKAHLEKCLYCRSKAKQLSGLQSRLTEELYRLPCPTPQALGEYHLGLLPTPETTLVRRHLDECPHCSLEVTQLDHYLNQVAPDLEMSLTERLKVFVAQRLPSLPPGGQPEARPFAPALAGLRGAASELRHYQINAFQISVEAQADPQTPGRRVVLGLVTGLGAEAWQAHLWHAGQLLTTVPVDSLGNFIIANLPPGQYELFLASSTVALHIPALDI